MGLLTSRPASSSDPEDAVPSHSYKYPPKSGSYFGTHFMMGGERFEVSQPEAYLFGENNDLNFFPSKPLPFPYSHLPSSEPARTLHCLAAVRRDSLKLVRTAHSFHEKPVVSDPLSNIAEQQQSSTCPSAEIDLTSFDDSKYNIEFTFDCDVPCTVTVYYFAVEEVTSEGLKYVSKRPELTSPQYQYDIGANHVFRQSGHIFDPSLYRSDELVYSNDTEVIPVVIHCVADLPDIGAGLQSHATLATVERSAEGHGFILKSLKQKIFVDGVCYLLQEIYGIENKNPNLSASASNAPISPDFLAEHNQASSGNRGDESTDDSGCECVVCMTELRDTLILPCCHLCLCNGCAETLRYKASSCPICRTQFRALLQIKTLRRIRCVGGAVSGSQAVEQNGSESGTSSGSFLNRYEPVPLVEALNGPLEAQTLTLPINPIPSNNNQLNTVNPAPVVNRNTAASKRTKNRKIRAPAPIQEVLTPHALVQRSPDDDEEDERSKSACSVKTSSLIAVETPEKSEKNLMTTITQRQPINEENSDDDYMEAHSISCGEIVAAPELEGPVCTDDESAEITFNSCDGGSAKRTTLQKPEICFPPNTETLCAKKKQDDDSQDELDRVYGQLEPGTRTDGRDADTPHSNYSVSSMASTQLLLNEECEMKPCAASDAETCELKTNKHRKPKS